MTAPAAAMTQTRPSTSGRRLRVSGGRSSAGPDPAGVVVTTGVFTMRRPARGARMTDGRSPSLDPPCPRHRRACYEEGPAVRGRPLASRRRGRPPTAGGSRRPPGQARRASRRWVPAASTSAGAQEIPPGEPDGAAGARRVSVGAGPLEEERAGQPHHGAQGEHDAVGERPGPVVQLHRVAARRDACLEHDPGVLGQREVLAIDRGMPPRFVGEMEPQHLRRRRVRHEPP